MPRDDMFVVELWETIHREMKKKVGTSGKPADWAEDIAQETIARFLEIEEWKGPRDHAINWCRRTAFRLFVDFTRREKGDISFDGVVGVSPSEGASLLWHNEYQPPTERNKRHVGNRLRQSMVSKITDTRDPATVTRKRECLQSIDPEWREHMEEGLDGTRGHKLDQATKEKIKRRARRLIGGA